MGYSKNATVFRASTEKKNNPNKKPQENPLLPTCVHNSEVLNEFFPCSEHGFSNVIFSEVKCKMLPYLVPELNIVCSVVQLYI